MLTYRSRYADVLFPFMQQVPFPVGYIAYMDICIVLRKPVYVTSISSTQGLLILSVATQDGALHCVFRCTENALTAKSQDSYGITGVLALSHVPNLSFSYSGLWQIQDSLVHVKRFIGSYTQIAVNNMPYPVPHSLDINFRGSVLVADSVIARYQDLTFGVPQTRRINVQSINKIPTQHLIISSLDLSIAISLPVVGDDIVTLYINTRSAFPTCN